MSRPASNIDVIESQQFKVVTQNLKPPGPPVTSTSSSAYHWLRDKSPAGGNSPKVGGIRLCRSWERNGRNVTLLPQSVTVEYRTNDSGGYSRASYIGGGFWVSGISPPEAIVPSQNMVNRSVVAALNKLKSQDIHLGNFFAEGQKTIDMVSQRASKIARSVQRFRSTNPKDWLTVIATQTGGLPRHLWCTIPDSWLELQYGWRPLLSDIYGALHHLSRTSRTHPPLVTVSARVEEKYDTSTTCTSVLGGSTGTLMWRNEVSTNCALAYKPSNFTLAELSSLGLVNPAEIVWELLPYSFVVDWFLPIGSWLSALTGDLGYTFVTGAQSHRSIVKPNGSSMKSYATFFGEPIRGVSPPSHSGSVRFFRRVCYTTSPVPGIYVKNPLSALHMANSIALLAQAFR